MIELYLRTGGKKVPGRMKTWIDTERWLDDGDPGEWFGVVTHRSLIRSIDLTSNGLKGPLPHNVGSLVLLDFLDLHNNQLTGPLHPAFGTLSVLSYLDLSSNQLNGEIPKELANLKRLRLLRLNNNFLRGPLPSELGHLVSMERLEVQHNRQLTGEIPPDFIAHFAISMKHYNLNLIGNRLLLPTSCKPMSNIQVLRLSRQGLHGTIPEDLGLLDAMVELDLSSNR